MDKAKKVYLTLHCTYVRKLSTHNLNLREARAGFDF